MSITQTNENDQYLPAGQVSEVERLQLQSRVWEPGGRRLLEEIGDGRGALDVGCGVLGWLRILSEWVGPDGEVTGTDIDDAKLATADRFATEERSVSRERGDWKAGRSHRHLLREFGIEGSVMTEVPALPPGHPYLRLPLQFATSLKERLLLLVSADELEEVREEGEAELQEPGRWGTTFTLLQCWGRVG